MSQSPIPKRDRSDQTPLRRSLGFWQLVFYGTGTILGAGVFVVIGEILAEAGRLAPLAYMLAAVIAVTSGLSFAEIAARVPTAGGACFCFAVVSPDHQRCCRLHVNLASLHSNVAAVLDVPRHRDFPARARVPGCTLFLIPLDSLDSNERFSLALFL